MLMNGLFEGNVPVTPDVNLTDLKLWQLYCGIELYNKLDYEYKNGRILYNNIDLFKTKELNYVNLHIKDNTDKDLFIQSYHKDVRAIGNSARDKGYISHRDIIINKKIKKNVKSLLNKNIEIIKINKSNQEEYLDDIIEFVINWQKERYINRNLDASIGDHAIDTYSNIYNVCEDKNVNWIIVKKDGEIIGSGLDEISEDTISVEMQAYTKYNSLADLINIYLTKTSPNIYRIMGYVKTNEGKGLELFKRKYAIGYITTYYNNFVNNVDLTEWMK